MWNKNCNKNRRNSPYFNTLGGHALGNHDNVALRLILDADLGRRLVVLFGNGLQLHNKIAVQAKSKESWRIGLAVVDWYQRKWRPLCDGASPWGPAGAPVRPAWPKGGPASPVASKQSRQCPGRPSVKAAKSRK